MILLLSVHIDFNVCGYVLMRFTILDMVLMMPWRGMTMLINIYTCFIWWLTWGFLPYFYGFYSYYNLFCGFYSCYTVMITSYDAHMDEPRERLYMGLIYMCYAPVVGGGAGVSITTNLGQSGDVTVSPRGLSRPIPMSSSGYDIWWFYDIKTYTYYCFKSFLCIIKMNICGLWRGIGLVLPEKV